MTHEEILMAMLLIAVVFLLATKLLPEPKPRDLSRGQALKDTPSDHVAKESKHDHFDIDAPNSDK